MTHECTRILEFDMAHRLQNHAGKCQHLHGHRYKAEVTCAGKLDAVGTVIDFGVVKLMVGGWIDEHLDHNTIYQADDMLMQRLCAQYGETCAALKIPHRPWHEVEFAPSSENLAKYLYDTSTRLLHSHGVEVCHVRLWETPNCYADWCGE